MIQFPFHIELTSEQFTLLSELSQRTHSSQQEVLTAALRQFCQDLPLAKNGAAEGATRMSFAEKLSGKGLLGCLDGGPADLSMNSRYLEGFGK
jgi:hypothetical protein